jgi:predicted MFS family arabinose efflux permease
VGGWRRTTVTTTSNERVSMMAAFRHRDFRLFWSAALLSNCGTWIQNLSVPFALDQLTHSTAVVGLGAFLAYIPPLLIGPLAGSLSDRHSRRSVLIWSQLGLAVVAFTLFALWQSGVASSVNILVCVTLTGTATGVTVAAWSAFVPQLVPPEHLAPAIRLNAVQFIGARTIGPALAGVVLAAWGPGAAFLANACSYLVVIGALLLIPARPVGDSGEFATVMAHFRDGLRYVRQRRALVLAVLTTGAIALFVSSVVQLLEPFTRQVLDVGAGDYGVLLAFYGAGTFVAVPLTGWMRTSRAVAIGLFLAIIAEGALALAPNYAWALAPGLAIGAAFSLVNIPVSTALQANVHESHRGRVSAVFMMAFFAGAPIGALVGGIVAQAVGLRATFLGATVLLAGYTAWILTRRDGLHPLDETIDPTAPPTTYVPAEIYE